jgi:hypothetical protein
MRTRIVMLAATLAGLSGLLATAAVSLDVTAAASRPVARADAGTVALKVATWNICGEFSGCPKIATTAELTAKRDAIQKLITEQNLDAVLLQETCEWYANSVLERLNGAARTSPWQLSFMPARQFDDAATNSANTKWYGRHVRGCANDRWKGIIEPDATDHAVGVAVLTKGFHDETTGYELPSPVIQYSLAAPLLCVRKVTDPAVPADAVRLCAAHFTPPVYDNAEGDMRRAQAARVGAIVSSFGTDRVVIGGDLNSYPADGAGSQRSTILTPLYDEMRECTMGDGTLRAGPPTSRWATGSGKLDYLFARSAGGNDKSLVTSCVTQPVDAAAQPYSDHAPIVGTFLL